MLGKDFLDMTLKIQKQIDKLNISKIKNFCSVKGTIKRLKDKLQTGRKYSQNTYLTNNLHLEHTKNSQNSSNHILKMSKRLDRHLTKEDIWMENKPMKRHAH